FLNTSRLETKQVDSQFRGLFTNATQHNGHISALLEQPPKLSHNVGTNTGKVPGVQRTSLLTSSTPLSIRDFHTYAPAPEGGADRIDPVRSEVIQHVHKGAIEQFEEAPPNTFEFKKIMKKIASSVVSLDSPEKLSTGTSVLYYLAGWVPSQFDQPLNKSVLTERRESLFSSTTTKALSQNRPFIRAQKEALAAFEGDVEKIEKKANGDEKETSRELYNYFLNNRDLLDKNMLSTLLTKFWNLGEYDYCVELVDNSKKKEFISAPETTIRYTRALLKSNYFNMERAIGLTDLLKERGVDDVELQALLGVIHAIKMNAVAKLIEIDEMDISDAEKIQLKMNSLEDFRKCFPEIKETDLTTDTLKKIWTANNEKSKDHYMQAWKSSRDPKYGVRVIHRLLEAGKLDEAKILAEHVQLTCIRDGVDNPSQTNQALTRAMLEVTLLKGSPSINKKGLDVSTLKNQLLLSCSTPAKTQHSITSLENFGRFLPGNEDVKNTISMLKKHKSELERSGDHQKVMEELWVSSPSTHSSTTRNFEDLATSYRSYFGWNFWSGNTRFGGQLTDHCIHKRDIAYFNEMLKIPLKDLPLDTDEVNNPDKTLGDIDDPRELSKIANQIIRYAFKTDEGLEKLNSPEHKIFDEKVMALFWYLGAPTSELRKNLPDTYTNIAFSLATGLGDCRHHAQVKQLLFDTWQRAKVDQWIEKIEAIDNMDPNDMTDQIKANRQEYVNLIDENLKTQMRVVHVDIHAPLQKDNDFLVWEGDTLVKDSDTRFIEEHSLNVLVDYDGQGNIEDVELADSFYHFTYLLQSGRIDFENFAQGIRVEGGKIKAWDPISEKFIEIPFELARTIWSEHINTKYGPGTTPAFMGMPVAEDSPFSNPRNLGESLSTADAAFDTMRDAYLNDL
ncbi:MAG: hypothetical protein AAGG81_09130, partial [Chlamydiota bacterium]